MLETLKKFYLETCGKIDDIVHLIKAPAKVELLSKFIELTVKDTVNIAEQELFLRRQMTYKLIKFNEVFSQRNYLYS